MEGTPFVFSSFGDASIGRGQVRSARNWAEADAFQFTRMSGGGSDSSAQWLVFDVTHPQVWGVASQLIAVADGIWIAQAPVRIVGTQLCSTMTVIQLRPGEVLLHSPIPVSDALRAEVTAHGEVTHLFAPNTFHAMSLGAWQAAFPEAKVHAPEGLLKKRPGLRIDRYHGPSAAEPELAFSDIDEIRIEGFRLEETAIIHRPTGTLVVADLVHNIGEPTHPWTKMYCRMMGFYGQVALSRAIRWSAFKNRKTARRSIDAILDRPLERIVVGHGAPVTDNASESLRTAFAWLHR